MVVRCQRATISSSSAARSGPVRTAMSSIRREAVISMASHFRSATVYMAGLLSGLAGGGVWSRFLAIRAGQAGR
ncbi:hypothetical protein [Streptosporangium sp. NPDC049046]|uniref:hypothetical protein n=1 Tax=Streptosporangium sp. NPDC049046 TaxID=3155031 RepID=UPI0034351ADC